jgi:hypothetical protein
MNPPIFNSAVYDGSVVRVFWSPGGGGTPTNYTVKIVGSDGSNFPQTTTLTFATVNTGPLSTSVTYTVQVCANSSGAPACTQQYILVTFQPVLTAADYDGTAVRFTWTPLPASVQNIDGYAVSLFPTTGGGQTFSVNVTGSQASSAVIPLTAPLTVPYSVQVTAQTTYGVGSATPSTPINITLPALTNAVYTGSAIKMTWAAPALSAVPVSGYLLTASSPDGGATFTQTITTATLLLGTITVPYPLDPAKRYFVKVGATTAGPVTTSTLPVPINTVQPRLLSVDYNGTALSAAWQPIGYPATPVTAYQLVASSTGGGSPITATVSSGWASSGSIPNPAFVAGLAYSFFVSAQSGVAATYSDSVPIFTALPIVTAAQYSGSDVVVTWTAPAGGTAAIRYRVTVSSATGSYSTEVPGTSLSATVATGMLATSSSWSVQVVAVNGLATATSAAAALAARQPVITSANYDGARLTVFWSAPSGVTVTGYVIRAFSTNGFGSVSSAVLGPTVVFGTITLTTPLDPAGDYFIVVDAQLAGGVTSSSAAVPLVTMLPIQVANRYDGTNVALSWTPVATERLTLSGYQLKVFSSQGGAVQTVTIPNGAATTGIVAGPSISTIPFVSQVCAVAGSVTSCSSQLTVIQSQPAVDSVSYDGVAVTVTWATVSGATQYLVSVLQGGAVVASAQTAGTSATLSANLDPSQPYTATVAAMVVQGAATAVGLPSTAANVISAAPGISSTTTTPTAVQVVVDTSATSGNNAVTGYRGYLYQGGKVVAGPTAAVTAAGVTTVTFTFTVEPQSSYSAAVQAVGTNITGPLGIAVPVLAAAPTVTSIVAASASAAIAWTPIAEATSYAVVLNGGTAQYTAAPSISLTIDLAVANAVTVAAISGIATGPPGGSVSLITETVGLNSVAFDGAFVSAAWDAAATISATYLLELLNDGVVELAIPFSATSGVFAAPLSASGAYSVRVRVVLGSVVGPPGTATDAITGIPAISAVATSATSVTVTLTAPSNTNGISGYQAALYIGDKLAAGPAIASGMSAAIPIAAALGPFAYSVRAQAIGTTAADASGPLGDPSPAIAATPQILAITYDGTNATVSWAPVTDPNVTGYSVVPTVGGAAQPAINVAGTSATFAASGATTVTLQAIGNLATGITTGPATVITETVAVTSILYDGTSINVTWNAATANGATYIVELLGGGAVVASLAVSGTSGVIPAALSGPASVRVIVVSGIATGSNGAAASVITEVPLITAIAASATQVVATLGGSTGYQGYLYQGATSVAGPTASATAGGVTTITFAYVVVPQYRYTVVVQTVGSPATSFAGPLSPPSDLISVVPEVTALDYDGSAVTAEWSAVLDPDVSGYAVTLTVDNVPHPAQYTSSTQMSFAIDAAKTNTISVQAVSDIALGPPSASASVLTTELTMTSALYDGATLTAGWSGAESGTSVVVLVSSGTQNVAQFLATGSSGSFGIDLSETEAYSVTAFVTSGIASAAPASAVAIIAAIPSVSNITADSDEVVVTITPPAQTAGITNYQASLYLGTGLVAGPVTATSTSDVVSATLTYSVAPQLAYTVLVNAIGATAASYSGPLSEAFPVISAVVASVDSDYDGTNVIAAWSPVAADGVTGYRMTVLQLPAKTKVGSAVDTASTEAAVAVSLALGTDYAVVVQALGAGGIGPQSAQSNPLAHSVGYFFPDTATSEYAYLFRGDIRGPAVDNVTLYLPDIFLNPLSASLVSGGFEISATAQGTALPYQLTVDVSGSPSAWTLTGNGIRPILQSDIQSLYSQVAPLAQPGGLALLQQVVAVGLPFNFAESLYYAYGLDGQNGFVDLQPGMRLRVDYENYQLTTNNSASNKLNGYAGTSTSYYDIVAMTTVGAYLPVAFDAFLAQLAVPTAVANTGGAGGIIDLQGPAYVLPYFRLFYPPTFPSSDSAGAIGSGQNAVILGASTYSSLAAATTQYLIDQTFTGVGGIVWTYFRGRAALMVEIQCFVNGVPVWVPLGTSVGQLLQRSGALPFNEATTVSSFAYFRSIGNVVDAPAQVVPVYALGRSNVVHFGFNALDQLQYTGGLTPFDLPVLMGDSLTLET